jgi:nitroreductase
MDALEALKTRRSVRIYKSEPVPAAIVEEIVDCARLAATARNVQPWEFVVVTKTETRRAIADIVDTGRFIANAPVCVIVFCRDTKYYLEDGSAAIENILLAARAHGLGSCWVAGDKKPYAPQIARLLGAPAEFKAIGLVAIGYAAESLPMPPKRSLAEVLHREKF